MRTFSFERFSIKKLQVFEKRSNFPFRFVNVLIRLLSSAAIGRAEGGSEADRPGSRVDRPAGGGWRERSPERASEASIAEDGSHASPRRRDYRPENRDYRPQNRRSEGLSASEPTEWRTIAREFRSPAIGVLERFGCWFRGQAAGSKR